MLDTGCTLRLVQRVAQHQHEVCAVDVRLEALLNALRQLLAEEDNVLRVDAKQPTAAVQLCKKAVRRIWLVVPSRRARGAVQAGVAAVRDYARARGRLQQTNKVL